jgi:hypothetical protein
MNNELLNTISEKLQQATKSSLLERKREKQEAEQHMAAIEDSLLERRTREEAEIEQTKHKLDQLGQLLEENVRGMTIQSTREGERVTVLREELEWQVEVAQKEHQDKVEDII